MDIKITNEWEFVPEAYGNADDERPVVFVLRMLTEPQRQGCMKISGTTGFDLDRMRIFRNGVKRIENLSVNGQRVESAKAFLELESALPAMFEEVVNEVLTNTLNPDLKNSGSPSDST